MKYSGIALHSNNAVVAVIDDQDRVLYCRRLTNDLPLIIAALAPFHEDLQGIVVESTNNWYWLVDGLGGRWLCRASCQHICHQAVRGTEVRWRRTRRRVSRAYLPSWGIRTFRAISGGWCLKTFIYQWLGEFAF
ncbi:hypothetical protein OKW29_002085 [Paraburkholderia sp. CI3]